MMCTSLTTGEVFDDNLTDEMIGADIDDDCLITESLGDDDDDDDDRYIDTVIGRLPKWIFDDKNSFFWE